MKKRKFTLLALLLLISITAASLAYFTASIDGTGDFTAHTVTLTDNTGTFKLTDLEGGKFVPGDEISIPIEAIYSGSATVKARVRILDGKTGTDLPLVDATATQGWAIFDGDTQVDPTANPGQPNEGYVKVLDSVVEYVATGAPISFPNLKIKLLEDSSNDYQESTVTVKYVVEVL